MHLGRKETPHTLFSGYRGVNFLAKIRHVILRGSKTTWANTDILLVANAFCKENPKQQIAIDELGLGDALKDFLEYMEMVPDGAIAAMIQDLKDLMSRHPIDR